MVTAWWLLLGALLAGYFVLGGYDHGAQMLTGVLGRGDRGRRSVLGAFGPFVLGNEVWLVAVAGVLFGAFPRAEGVLLVGLFPLVVPLLLGLVLGNAAVQLRSRVASAGGRRLADALVVLGGALPAGLWGTVLGVLLRGVERRPDGYVLLGAGDLADPFVLLCGLATLALFLVHGACFLALRTSGELAARAGRVVRRGAPVAAVLIALAVATTTAEVPNPFAALVAAGVLVAALAGAAVATAARRPALAFATSSIAAAAPVVLLGVAQFPFLLVTTSGPPLSIADGATEPATLALLSVVAVVAVPVVAGVQVWSWWAMRGRVDEHAPSYH